MRKRAVSTDKSARINKAAVEQVASWKRIEAPFPCHLCGSLVFVEVPLHGGETIRVDCAECDCTCHNHWYQKKKRHKKDSGYQWLSHVSCRVCRATIGFSKWHGKPMDLVPAEMLETVFDEEGERWWESCPEDFI